MKLIDMLVEDGLNGWQWPDGVEAITQDSDKSINKYKTAKGLEINERGTWRYSSSWQGYLLRSCDMSSLADDCATSIITREQYEAAMAAKNEGWIEWDGGERPVAMWSVVDFKMRSGEMSTRYANVIRWDHKGIQGDIIAYRLHKPQEAEQPKSDEEADLNECIGQGVAPVWNGEGLPPVGCECQYRKHKKSEQSEWFNGVVKYTSEFTVVIQPVCYPGETVGHPANFEFRPIRSTEDEKRDDRASAIDGFISGFRGQETGSNKELAYALTDYLALLDKL